MSRVYATVSLPHKELVPKFSVETADHTGGGFAVGGLHPSSIAAFVGKGPEVKKQPRFDLKFNLNSQRTSVSVVVNTTKQLPHVEWSSNGGLGKLPMLGLGAIASQFLMKGPPNNGSKRSSRSISSSKHVAGRQRSHRSPPKKQRKPIAVAPHKSTPRRPSSSSPKNHHNDAYRTPVERKNWYEEPVPLAQGTAAPPPRSRENSSSFEGKGKRPGAARRRDWGYDSGYASAEDSDYRMGGPKPGLNRGEKDVLKKSKGPGRPRT